MEQEKSNLNRSFSEPDIHSNYSCYRRIFIEEYPLSYPPQNYDKSQPNAIKRHTYIQEFFSSSSSLETLKYNSSVVDNSPAVFLDQFSHVNSPSTYNSQCVSALIDNKVGIENGTADVEDMDIDDYEIEESIDLQPQLFPSDRSKLRRLNNRNYKNQEKVESVSDNKSNVSKFCKIICAVLVIIIAWLYYTIFITEPTHDTAIAATLDNILYQNHVRDVAIKNYNELQTGIIHKKLLVFVGTTGVGKTYTVNLIRKHFPQKFVIDVNFLLESHLSVDNIEASMRSDGCYFITIDDLKMENLKDVVSYIEKLPDKCALIVPIFNIHRVDDNLVYTMNYDDYREIHKEFINKFSYVDIVMFNDISRDNLEIWLRDQIREKGLVNKEDAITSLLDEHDVNIYGFKGVLAKINVL